MTGRARARRPAGRLLPVAGALSLAACTPAPFVGEPLAAPRAGGGTWAGLAQEIFVPECASTTCHGGTRPEAFPEIDAAHGWSAMVNVQSQQAVMALVKPGDPDASWLVHRLEGEQGYMPPGAPLSAEEIAAVVDWIARGAPND